jgi:hypothetical protein
MSHPIACEHGRATVASVTQPILDYGWWASNGPTAGYLMRLAAERCSAHSGALRIGLDSETMSIDATSQVGTAGQAKAFLGGAGLLIDELTGSRVTFVAPAELTVLDDLAPGAQYRTWSPITATLITERKSP